MISMAKIKELWENFVVAAGFTGAIVLLIMDPMFVLCVLGIIALIIFICRGGKIT